MKSMSSSESRKQEVTEQI